MRFFATNDTHVNCTHTVSRYLSCGVLIGNDRYFLAQFHMFGIIYLQTKLCENPIKYIDIELVLWIIINESRSSYLN